MSDSDEMPGPDPAVSGILRSCDVWDMTLPWTPEHQDLELLRRFRRAGYTFVSASVQDFPATFEGVSRCVRAVEDCVSRESDWLHLATRNSEIEVGRRSGKLVIGINVQDTLQLGMDVARVEALRRLGVRHMLLAYQTRNFVADGCAEISDAGLSNFGRLVVREMNRVGMVVDCSHTGRRSSLEAIELSERPPIFSHSGAYAVCAHIRNIHDDQIRACSARGGVIGIVGIGAFLGDPRARAETLFEHIDHVATLVGPEHVGLGTDFVKDMPLVWEAMKAQKHLAWPDPTGTQLYEGGCFQPEQLSSLVSVLLRRGYSSPVIQGILGGNFKRVYSQSEVQ
jgi:membrane dipeptidase